MSLFNYFSRLTPNQQQDHPSTSAHVTTLPPHDNFEGINLVEYANVAENLRLGCAKNRRQTYKEEEKIRITKYANSYGTTAAIKFFKNEFPNLRESTVRPWLATYRDGLKRKDISSSKIVISKRRGKPLYLPNELDEKLRKFLLNLRRAGGDVNRHVVYGVLMGLVKSNLLKYGSMLDFKITNGWMQYLYKRLNFSRRVTTTSRPVITESIWLEMRTRFLYNIAQIYLEYDVPDELIMNIDQTSSKYVTTDRVTMGKKGSKHVSKKGSNDKRAITATYAETLAGDILPFQLIYQGKTVRSIPNT